MFWKKERNYKFIATFELGRLAKWLRIMGFDVDYFKKGKKRDLIIKSLKEDRVILTREKGMSRFSGTRMLHIENDFVEDQIRQVLGELRIKADRKNVFTRCILCNTPIQSVEKRDVKEKIPPYVYKTQNYFLKCPQCNKIYWKGTHWKLVNDFLKKRSKT